MNIALCRFYVKKYVFQNLAPLSKNLKIRGMWYYPTGPGPVPAPTGTALTDASTTGTNAEDRQ